MVCIIKKKKNDKKNLNKQKIYIFKNNANQIQLYLYSTFLTDITKVLYIKTIPILKTKSRTKTFTEKINYKTHTIPTLYVSLLLNISKNNLNKYDYYKKVKMQNPRTTKRESRKFEAFWGFSV